MLKYLIPRQWLVRILVWSFVDRLRRAELKLEDEQVIALRTSHALPSARFRQHRRQLQAELKLNRLHAELRELPRDVQERIDAALKAEL